MRRPSKNIQRITDRSATAQHPEAEGFGNESNDRDIVLYYDCVRDHVGGYE
jgi:hypothetical protein